MEITLDVESGTVHFAAENKEMYKRARSAVKALLQFFFPKEFSRLALKPDVFAATFPKEKLVQNCRNWPKIQMGQCLN